MASLEMAPLAIVYILFSALFLDWKTVGVMYAIKTYRLLTMWIIVYAVEKVFLENYLRRVYVEHVAPPDFSLLIWVCWAIEFITFTIPMFVLALLYTRYKAHDNTFVIDGSVMQGLVTDYVLSSTILVSLGLIGAAHVQDRSLFRYDHDGMRGIRAGAQLFFLVSAVVLLVPFYSIAEDF